MVAISKSVSFTVDTQSGAFIKSLLVSGQRGQAYGCWIYATLLGQRQTFDARLEISSRLPLQTDIRTNLCLEAFLKINPCVWCTTCVTMRKELVL